MSKQDTSKTTGYTDEQTREMLAAYADVASASYEARSEVVKELADSFGTSVASVRGKLTREGVYIPKEYQTKKGGKPESKAAIVTQIAAMIGSEAEAIESLEKATKGALEKVRAALIAASKASEASE